jgi:hypothetical protein
MNKSPVAKKIHPVLGIEAKKSYFSRPISGA